MWKSTNVLVRLGNNFYMAEIFTPGVAKSLLGGKHIKRTRQADLLTITWIHILETDAYQQYLDSSITPYEPLEI